ncbi:hypothetical protein [Novosphingobium sp. MMS21-SN21R]|uniref:hypothetical protein n=1 Tax=Novosphingobium sp. MMS21-SN21R TaxID=2969298 RepID=UPI0028857B13|nr:hypothetical protein [Novosphingobium sp. MMS21-SN21R]MDT0506594.1 hypothetical protein [Novosphingobium sp. MMS21-SN21R]
MGGDVERYRTFAAVRVNQLDSEDTSLRRWLLLVRLGSWPLQLVSIVFPVAAGSFSISGFANDATLVPLFSFVGAAAVALHRGLNCDAYQSALKRTTQAVRSIIEDYECIAALADEKVADALKKAEARLHELRATSNDVPPRRRQSLRNLGGVIARPAPTA